MWSAAHPFQVMGGNLMHPADALICWTKDGAIDAASAKNAGGTRTAVIFANESGIPVFNLQRPEVAAMFLEWVGADLLAEVKPALRMKGPPKVKSTNSSGQFANKPTTVAPAALPDAGAPVEASLRNPKTPRFRFRAHGR